MATRTVEIKVTGNTRDLEAQLERAGLVADASGKKLGQSFSDGASKAGGALSKLGQEAANWGIPFAGSLQTIGKHLDETTTKTQRLHGVLSEMGKVTLLGGAAGLAAVATEAIKLGESYETAQAKIRGATGQSEQSAAKLTKAFEATAGKFESSGQAMEGAYSSVAGQLKLTEGRVLSTGEAMKFQAAATELNTAVQGQLGQTTAAVASVMQSYHLKVSQAAEATDVLYNVSKGVNVPVEQVASTMDKLHGRLGELAPSMQDVGGLMLDLAHHGVAGSRGAQVVNSALQTLVGGSKKTTEMLEALHVHVFDASGKFVGLGSVISQLQPKLDGLTQKNRTLAEQTLFGKGAAQVLGQVMLEGAGAFDRNAQAAAKAGTAHRAAEQQSKTFHGEMERLKSTVETLGGALGLMLIPKLTAVAHVLSEGIQWLEKHKEAAKALAVVISTVLGAAVAVFAYDKAAAFGKGIQNMVGGLKSLAGASTTTAGEVGAAESTMVAETDAAAASMDAALVTTGIGAALIAVGIGASELMTHWESVMHTMEKVSVEVANVIVAALNKIKQAAEIAAEGPLALRRLIPGLGGNVIPNIPGISEGGGGGHGSTAKIGAGNFAHQQGQALRESEIFAGLLHGGVSPLAGKAIIKILGGESGLNPTNEGAEGAYGIAQWLGPRRRALEQYAGATHQSGNAVSTQVKFLLKELHGEYGGTLHALNSAHGIREAEGIFLHGYEKPEEGQYGAIEGRGAAYGSNAAVEATGAAKAKKAKEHAAALGIPVGVVTMLKTAEALQGTAYTYGGGHGGWDPVAALKKIGVDCTGFVSQVLHSGGVLSTPQDTVSLPSAKGIGAGAGRYVTIYDRPKPGQEGHALIDILGHYFESGGNSAFNPKGGVSMLTAAQAAGELRGGGFQAFHPTSLNAPVRGGVSSASAGAGTSILAAIAKSIEAEIKHLQGSGEGLYKRLENAAQTGQIKPLEKLLGYQPSTGKLTGPGAHETSTLVKELKATHDKALEELAQKLVTAHTTALRALNEELGAEQEKADARGLALQATQLKDQTTLLQNMANQVVQAMKDAAQAIADSFSAVATEIRDRTQEMSDASSARVTAIGDASKIIVDKLGERGLYGLNLVAQQEQVQLDEMKAGFDSSIAAAKAAADSAQTASDKAAAATTAIVDAVTARENTLIAQAQTHLDQVTATQDKAVQEAQNAVSKAATGTQAQQDVAAAALAKAEATASVADAEAQAALQAAQSHASQAEQEAQGAVASAKGNAEVVLAQAAQTLAEAEARANVAQAEQTKLIEETKAKAATQYAGSGLTINVTGVNPTDGYAVASEVGWRLRTQLPA